MLTFILLFLFCLDLFIFYVIHINFTFIYILNYEFKYIQLIRLKATPNLNVRNSVLESIRAAEHLG